MLSQTVLIVKRSKYVDRRTLCVTAIANIEASLYTCVERYMAMNRSLGRHISQYMMKVKFTTMITKVISSYCLSLDHLTRLDDAIKLGASSRCCLIRIFQPATLTSFLTLTKTSFSTVICHEVSVSMLLVFFQTQKHAKSPFSFCGWARRLFTHRYCGCK